jgi:hypothetical protein
MQKVSVLAMVACLGLVAAVAPMVASGQMSAQGTSQAKIEWTPVPGPNKKCPVNADYFFKYDFDKKPQMGMVILKIQVFNKNGEQVTPYAMTGRSDMPSMRGAHDSGEVEFKLNKTNNYLLPVNVVMPGDWEVRVTFLLNGQAVFHGSIRFDV